MPLSFDSIWAFWLMAMGKRMIVLMVAAVIASSVGAVQAQPINASKLSLPYRNWHYYIGAHQGFVVPPDAGSFRGQSLTDTAIVYQKTSEDQLPGNWRMTYLFFNNTPGSYGYEAALATSSNLLDWDFGHGGQHGLVFPRSDDPSAFDYGGVTLGGLHFTNASLKSPRTLRKSGGKYHALYGCYPSRAGYEAGNGGEGIAYSEDGVSWERVSRSVPILSGGSPSLRAWESEIVYQPFLLEHNNTLWNFYNAKGETRTQEF